MVTMLQIALLLVLISLVGIVFGYLIGKMSCKREESRRYMRKSGVCEESYRENLIKAKESDDEVNNVDSNSDEANQKLSLVSQTTDSDNQIKKGVTLNDALDVKDSNEKKLEDDAKVIDSSMEAESFKDSHLEVEEIKKEENKGDIKDEGLEITEDSSEVKEKDIALKKLVDAKESEDNKSKDNTKDESLADSSKEDLVSVNNNNSIDKDEAIEAGEGSSEVKENLKVEDNDDKSIPEVKDGNIESSKDSSFEVAQTQEESKSGDDKEGLESNENIDSNKEIENQESIDDVSDNSKPNILTEARDGKPDNLCKIKGIGTVIETKLNKLGIFHFDQIASWTEKEIAWIDKHLAFSGRIIREDWVGQAKILASGEETEFSKRVEKGEVESSRKD